MDDRGFIKFIRNSKECDMLMLRRPTAFVLLALIAKRAKRTIDHPYPELKMGEALIGDYETYGVTERIYRTDKEYLKKLNFSTFRTTNKGTIAKLTNSSVFDINIEGERRPKQRTKRQASDDQATTNKNDKNAKKDSSKTGQQDIHSVQQKIKVPPEYADDSFKDDEWNFGGIKK